MKSKWNPKTVADALRRLREETGEQPTSDEPYKALMRKIGCTGGRIDRPYPSYSTILGNFGTLRDAWKAAGFPVETRSAQRVPTGDEKRCSKCKTSKDRTEFAVKRANPDGLQGWCRPCVRAVQSAHYHAQKNGGNGSKPKPRTDNVTSMPVSVSGNLPAALVPLGERIDRLEAQNAELLSRLGQLATASDDEVANAHGWVRVGIAIGMKRGAH